MSPKDQNPTPKDDKDKSKKPTATNPKTDNKQPVSSATGQLGTKDKSYFSIPAHPKTKFDEKNFLSLLEGSISLTLEEKQRVIDAIPRLSIEQINELIKIFEDEKVKFAELEGEFKTDVEKLKKEREREFEMAEIKKQEENEADSDADQAADIKAGLDL